MQDGRDTVPAVERWAGAGHSDDSDSARAGRDAVAAAITGDGPRLVVVFASPRHDFDALAQAAQEAAGPAALIGCSGGAGVSAFALGGTGFSVATASTALNGAGSRAAGKEVASCLADLHGEAPHRALILLTDGVSGDTPDVVRGAYSLAGAAVSLAGGCAGVQLHGPRSLRGSVVAAALGSNAPLGTGVRHGWRPRGDPLLVTGSEGQRLLALNERPALDVYLELLDARADTESGSVALLHPLGVAAARGHELQVRAVVDADFDARTLSCSAEVPVGTLVWPMEGSREDVLEATTLACEEALSPFRTGPPLGLVAFGSVARAALLGPEGAIEEHARIAAAAGGATVGRVSTFGEIARTSGSVGVHSHALAVLAIG